MYIFIFIVRIYFIVIYKDVYVPLSKISTPTLLLLDPFERGIVYLCVIAIILFSILSYYYSKEYMNTKVMNDKMKLELDEYNHLIAKMLLDYEDLSNKFYKKQFTNEE